MVQVLVRALLVAGCAGAWPARAQTSLWFNSFDPQSHAEVLDYRKGPVAIGVVLYPRDHTADGGVAVTGSWLDCTASQAALVDQSGQREALTGGCPPQAQGVGVFNASHKSTTLGHILAHARRLELVIGSTTVPIELSGLQEAFSQAAAYQEHAPDTAGDGGQAGAQQDLTPQEGQLPPP